MTEPLYHSDLGLYDFQAEDIAKGYLMPSGLVAWDTGTGKSHWAMAISCLLVEDDEIDVVVLIAEKNKIADDEWVGDFEQFTKLDAHRYHGTGRQKRLEKLPEFPRVIITTYETAKADLVKMETVPGKRTKAFSPGPLSEMIGDRRPLVIFDESTKIKNRSSATYKAMYWWVNRYLRKRYPKTRAWGLTATPLETGWEDAFNQARLLWPPSMPTVEYFEQTFVSSRDPYNRPTYRRERMPEFVSMFRPIILRRRKTDPELIDQFPKMVEDARHFVMGDEQRKFYEMVEEIGFPLDAEEPEPGMLTLMRQIAGHPASILFSQGMFAQVLAQEFGADYLRSIPSVKTEGLVDYLTPIIHGQGDKALTFTFFGQSVLPLLAEALREKKMEVFTHHGGQTSHDQELARTKFRKYDGPAVFLTSDAGSRGINMPEATYVVEYESALTYALRKQRIDRIHRIISTAPTTNAMTFFLDHTVEARLALNMSERNAQSDMLLGDDEDGGEHFLTAAERKDALRIARSSVPTRKAAPRNGRVLTPR